jgi:hypothetical protein
MPTRRAVMSSVWCATAGVRIVDFPVKLSRIVNIMIDSIDCTSEIVVEMRSLVCT